MRGTITEQGGATQPATVEAAKALLATTEHFWLDIDDLGSDGIAMLGDDFKFHPLAVEDAEHFGQRPKVEDYGDFTFLVIQGPPEGGNGGPEVHCFYTNRCLVTVRRQPCPAMDRVRQRVALHPATQVADPHLVILYLVMDELIDDFFPVLSSFDDSIDTLEDAILKDPTEEQLGRLFEMKRSLVAMRKIVTPQRDMIGQLASGVTTMPGLNDDSARYFRDLYDHTIRISDLVDSYRDLVSGATDTHLSMVSNRLNVVMKQLTIIATVFLPLSFLTGFFGQNFAWLVTRITTGISFWVVAVGLELTVVVVMLALFRKRGWLGGPTA